MNAKVNDSSFLANTYTYARAHDSPDFVTTPHVYEENNYSPGEIRFDMDLCENPDGNIDVIICEFTDTLLAEVCKLDETTGGEIIGKIYNVSCFI